jgi:hypothetical protein
MLYETLKEKYQATDYSSEVAHNPLSYILRKAETSCNLNSIEWEWLQQQKLHKTIEVIRFQESYRDELRQSLILERSEIGYRNFIRSFTVPDINSCLLFALYKISAQEILTVNDIDEACKENGQRTNLNAYNEYILLKNKYEIIEGLPFSTDALRIISKIDVEKKLSVADIEWLIERNVYSVFAALKAEISRLNVKYSAIDQSDDYSATLYLILQKLEENRSLADQDIAFLKSKQLNETVEIAQKLEFAWLKRFYKATQIEDCSPNHHLYKLLKKLRGGLLLNEPDINYLKKRKLTETIDIVFKPQLQVIENKIRSGESLSSEDQAWCEKFQFNDLLYMALRAKYKVLNYSNQSAQSPLYSILQKLEQGERLSGVNVVWLQGENLFKPINKIFARHYELEAIFAEQEYQRTKNKWFLVDASSYWRKADEPEKALHLTEQIDFNKIKEAKLKQALLTTRGGALRDLGNLTGAEKCALQAIEYWSKSHNPYTLLGAICYGTGRYVEGDRWFEEARKCGATERDVDTEIKRIVQKTKDKKELQALIDYLLNKDSQRYAWVNKYRKSG